MRNSLAPASELIQFCSLQIQVKPNNSSKILAQTNVNSTTTMILLNNLTVGSSYTARVAAMTRVGLGPYSGAVPIFMDPYVTSNVSASRSGLEYWFFAISALFVLTVVVGIVLLVYLKKRQRSEKTLGHFDGEFIFFNYICYSLICLEKFVAFPIFYPICL